ncbi:NAD-dependent epimerase/dehydratase family protein [Mucilaginibacter terrenus]|uniref:NAD-dependent epimerase/dehydratase family protein n=2 Tax=Mucilaginibacter terrenus TaxID=2482727 RepID=A0A3E2NYN4_9SPHI|nr:NAD-dependent epimerase/dehydratase family protein [Mucilaginibacter terrenus]
MQNTPIAIIGGTGKAGKYIVKQLLQHQYQIKFLHRDPSSVPINNPLIEFVTGDARNPKAIAELLSGCGVVISAVGQPAGEPPIFSQTTQIILDAMQELGVSRYISLTGLNVDTPFDTKSAKTKFGTDWMYQNYPKTTADKQVEYDVLSARNVDWTLIRLPMIQQTDELPEVITSLEDCPGDFISASSLGKWIVDQLGSSSFSKKAPFLANTGS